MATLHSTRDELPNDHYSVRNLDASVAFYVHTLGFEVVRREEDQAMVRLGHSVVRLAAASRGRSRGRLGPATPQSFTVPDVDGVYRRVRSARLVVITEARDRASKVRDFVTVDPDGFPIRLSAAV